MITHPMLTICPERVVSPMRCNLAHGHLPAVWTTLGCHPFVIVVTLYTYALDISNVDDRPVHHVDIPSGYMVRGNLTFENHSSYVVR